MLACVYGAYLIVGIHCYRVVLIRALASIATNEKPSLFDTPSCFMAKATKVQTCDDDGVMMNMVMKMIVIVIMMNLLKMNYLIC